MTTTWWKRCYEGLRGARVVSPFLGVFTGRFVCVWLVLCLFVFVSFAFLSFCLPFFGLDGENSCIQLAFHFFCKFLVVDRPCPVLARQCRREKKPQPAVEKNFDKLKLRISQAAQNSRLFVQQASRRHFSQTQIASFCILRFLLILLPD